MAFKRVIIWRVGPLSWLLDGLELFSRALHISRLLLVSHFSSSTRQLLAACAGLSSGVSSPHQLNQVSVSAAFSSGVSFSPQWPQTSSSSRGTGTTCVMLSTN